MAGKVWIGTSGWNYKHWVGPFYPQDLAESEWLRFYSEHFETVEINNSFYHLPAFKTLVSWRQTVSNDFTFAMKASRFITHMKKLKALKTSTRKFFRRARRLETRLGPILFQLPPRWRVDLKRLRRFLASLSENYRYSFEFRDQSWFRAELFELLKEYQVALCLYHQTGFDSPVEVTTDFVYVRLHGTESKYGGSYPASVLKEWARRIDSWRNDRKTVYFYFNNDPHGYAVKNAQQLKALVH